MLVGKSKESEAGDLNRSNNGESIAALNMSSLDLSREMRGSEEKDLNTKDDSEIKKDEKQQQKKKPLIKVNKKH